MDGKAKEIFDKVKRLLDEAMSDRSISSGELIEMLEEVESEAEAKRYALETE